MKKSRVWTAGGPFDVGQYPLTRVISIASHGGVIAHVNCKITTEAQAQQTANEIAALPQLVEALQIVMGCRPNELAGVTLGSYELDKIRAALQLAGIAEMVAALECDYDRLTELRDMRQWYKGEIDKYAKDSPDYVLIQTRYDEWFADNGADLEELEAAAGDCESREVSR